MAQVHDIPEDPSELPFESVPTRRWILVSYWLVVLASIPIWWKLTSIDRMSLPVTKVSLSDSHKLRLPVRVHISSEDPSYPAQVLEQEVSQRLQRQSGQHGIYLDQSSQSTASVTGTYDITITDGHFGMSIAQRRLVVGTKDPAGVPVSVADTLADLIQPRSESTEALRVVKYAPRYRVAFSLLNEDASSGSGVISWDVEEAIQRYLSSTLEKLSVLHNFTIESQVQYHAPLAFLPQEVRVDDQTAHGLTPEDLTVFVNSAEWTLSSSVSNDPVIHFIVFVPSSQNHPLYILNPDGTPSSADTFILPQWGGITILNQATSHISAANLEHAFTMFRSQLLSLLGLPSLPPNVQYDEAEPFTDWQLDALIRLRTKQNIDNSRDTLKSIVALVDQIENMPVGQDVKGDVQGSLDALDKVFAEGSSSLISALHHSSDALTRASRAFFNPGMLALLYFPAEHKYAVYTPLFASVAAPLIAAIMREVAAWRKARKQQAQARREGTERLKVD